MVIFYWTTTKKLKFTDWPEVHGDCNLPAMYDGLAGQGKERASDCKPARELFSTKAGDFIRLSMAYQHKQ